MKQLFEQMALAESMVNRFVEDGQELSFEMYLATVAMTVEERCKSEGLDVREVFYNMYRASKDVVDELGAY